MVCFFHTQPQDGATELIRSDIEDGNEAEPTTFGQCHTTEMAHPSQGIDNSRNKRMNQYAARD
jgi:hypothetical protein